jgi:hypothetical protein
MYGIVVGRYELRYSQRETGKDPEKSEANIKPSFTHFYYISQSNHCNIGSWDTGSVL